MAETMEKTLEETKRKWRAQTTDARPRVSWLNERMNYTRSAGLNRRPGTVRTSLGCAGGIGRACRQRVEPPSKIRRTPAHKLPPTPRNGRGFRSGIAVCRVQWAGAMRRHPCDLGNFTGVGQWAHLCGIFAEGGRRPRGLGVCGDPLPEAAGCEGFPRSFATVLDRRGLQGMPTGKARGAWARADGC